MILARANPRGKNVAEIVALKFLFQPAKAAVLRDHPQHRLHEPVLSVTVAAGGTAEG